jgi:hypothetical protein
MSIAMQKPINPYENAEFLEQAFIRLCEIRRKIQELQKEEEIIKDWALFYAQEYLLRNEKEGEFEINDFTVKVSIAQRKVFEYPEEIKKLEEELKNKKKQAELNGTAKLIAVNRYLVFKF